MAVPTIVRILPAGRAVGDPVEGPTAGRSLVEIYGDGFRLPPAPPADGPSGPVVAGGLVVAAVPQTVEVTFGGEAAPEVEVVRSNLLRVLTPPTPIAADAATNHGAGAVDVVVQNLDDMGDPIVGESVTVASGYTYRRPKLDSTVESDLLRVVVELIRLWKRDVVPEVVLTTHTDFDPDLSTAFVEIAQMPAVALNLTGLPENRFYSLNEGPEDAVGEAVTRRRKPRTVDLEFDIVGISDNPMEVLELLTVANEFMDRNPYLEVLRDPADPGAGAVRYELDIQPGGDFEVSGRPNNSNVHSFTGAIVVRGFDFEGLASFGGDSIRGLTTTLHQGVSLDVEKK